MRKSYVGIKSLRKKITKQLNSWTPLNCIAMNGDTLFPYALPRSKEYAYRRLIFGITRDGRGFILYPQVSRHALVNIHCALMMQEYESRGAVAGCVTDILDAWDVVFNDESQYKRKKRTYSFREVKPKEKEDDESE